MISYGFPKLFSHLSHPLFEKQYSGTSINIIWSLNEECLKEMLSVTTPSPVYYGSCEMLDNVMELWKIDSSAWSWSIRYKHLMQIRTHKISQAVKTFIFLGRYLSVDYKTRVGIHHINTP